MKVLAGTLLLLGFLAGCGDQPVPLGNPEVWTVHPADGVVLELGDEDGALRLDFVFTGGGYAIASREVDLDLPVNYAFRFRVKGDAPTNHLEFKLVDDSGENVWWNVRRDVEWPAVWETFNIKKRQIEFAWGPQGGGELRHVAAIEFAITAGEGGTGTVWIDDLQLVPMPAITGPPPEPKVTATSAQRDHPADLVLDGDPETRWFAGPSDEDPSLTMDFGGPREYGGLTVVWGQATHASNYRIEVSDDGTNWETLWTVTGGDGGRDHLFLPETESRWLRLQLGPERWESPPGVAELVIRPLEWSATREAFFMNIAAEAPRGMYPRGFLGEPTAWTVVGVDRDSREGLLGADGAVEVGPGEFSLEPFLWADSRLITWNDVETTLWLSNDDLPLPRVRWTSGSWRLTVSPQGTGEPERSSMFVEYRVENIGETTATAKLFLAVRPFQVNPPVQFLNVRGGTARFKSVEIDGRDILVDGRTRIRLLRDPDGFGATTFAGGDVVADHLVRGYLPLMAGVVDPFAAPSAAAAFEMELAPGAVQSAGVFIPLHEESPLPESWDAETTVATTAEAMVHWSSVRDQVVVNGPSAARDAIATLKAQVGWIMVNRAGVRIQPGARSYARSWIRDGALTGVALLRMGHGEAVRDFLEWYAPHQYENGKIPCVVDSRGADPVPEHDSTGEFIYLLTEYYRYTDDREMLDAQWPRVQAGVRYLESLLAERSTAEYRAADKREFYGILPPSISHEGYSAKPMHSYWDDFFALRGFKNAAWLAGELVAEGADSLAVEYDRLVALRDRFAADLGASVAAAMTRHGIDYVPGCADLGDFDATSTTIALDPAAAQDILPANALDSTFERYWEFFDGRARGEPWEAFTPYEIRNIGAFVRLGWRVRAQDLLEFFLDHRTPIGWRQWAEVVASDSTAARFIGDMPHTWVGSDYVRSFLDMFWYERRAGPEGPAALVLAAGLPAAWLETGGVTLAMMPTPYGKLGYRLSRDGDGTVMKIDKGLMMPPGGLLLDPPTGSGKATIKGNPADLDQAGRVIVSKVPVEVRWRP